jgi:hypothetical protein
LSLWMSRWISELNTVDPFFYLGLGSSRSPIVMFLWQSKKEAPGTALQEMDMKPGSLWALYDEQPWSLSECRLQLPECKKKPHAEGTQG